MRDRSCGQHEYLRQGEHFALPRSRRPLMILDHRTEHQRHERVNASRGGKDVLAGDRIAFLRHRRRAAATSLVRLEQLGDFRLRQQNDIGRDLGEAAAD